MTNGMGGLNILIFKRITRLLQAIYKVIVRFSDLSNLTDMESKVLVKPNPAINQSILR